MSNGSGTYKQFPTRPIPRSELAPKEVPPIDEEETLVHCEMCKGAGLVHPDIAVLTRRLLERTKENQ